VFSVGLSLVLYLAATVLYQGHLFLRRREWGEWGRKMLLAGACVHTFTLGIHFIVSKSPYFSNSLFVVSLFVVTFLFAGLWLEHALQIRKVGAILAPLAFLAVLSAALRPASLEGAGAGLLKDGWLVVHIALSLLGDVGFALAFGMAAIYLLQEHWLKSRRLNRVLPPLDVADNAGYLLIAVSFSLFSLGLAMGLIAQWVGSSVSLGRVDLKVLASIPCWGLYALYLYLRAGAGWRGHRLNWLSIVGFALVLFNLLVLRHEIIE